MAAWKVLLPCPAAEGRAHGGMVYKIRGRLRPLSAGPRAGPGTTGGWMSGRRSGVRQGPYWKRGSARQGLGDTFKKIRGEIAAQDEQMTGRSGNSSVAKHQLENSAQKSGLESELDMNNMVGVGDGVGEDGDALMMEQSPQSPG